MAGMPWTTCTFAALLLPAIASAQPPVYTSVSPEPVTHGHFNAVGIIGDLNGDAIADLLVTETEMPPVGEPRRGERGHIVSGANGAVLKSYLDTKGYYMAPLSDITGDGKPEFVTTWGTAATVSIYSGTLSATPIETITAPASNTQGGFGEVVYGLADLTGDGKLEFAVAATGALYVYDGATRTVLYDVRETSQVPMGVLDSGKLDLTGDGVPDLMLLQNHLQPGAGGSGGHVFIISGSDGSFVHTIESPAPPAATYFAVAAAQIPDFTGDSVADLAVSGNTSSGGTGGVVYLYDSATWQVVRVLHSTLPEEGNFGYHLAAVGDLDGDSIADLAVGSLGRAIDGRVSFYSPVTGKFIGGLICPDPEPEEFSTPMALPDLENDGKPNFLINALGGTQNLEGKIYVYNGLDLADEAWVVR